MVEESYIREGADIKERASELESESEPTTLRSDASSAKAADDTVSNNNPP